jgi:hypothetical protein
VALCTEARGMVENGAGGQVWFQYGVIGAPVTHEGCME